MIGSALLTSPVFAKWQLLTIFCLLNRWLMGDIFENGFGNGTDDLAFDLIYDYTVSGAYVGQIGKN